MEQFWRRRNFKLLSQTWNKKLEESGFQDAEVEIRGDRSLKQRAVNAYRQAPRLERETRLEYFMFLGYLAHNTMFPSQIEKYIMIRHADGATIQEIAFEIDRIGISRTTKTIGRIIRRWQMKWGVKSWSLKQMHLKKFTG